MQQTPKTLSTPDPFDLLGLEPSVHLDADALEARYIELSRQSHPDHHGKRDDPARLAEVMARSAAVNDAYSTLRDRWSRARALLDRLDPAAHDAHKKLDPVFLAEAMDVAEEVAGSGEADRGDLERRLRARVDEFFEAVGEALDAGDAPRAATLLHQSKYYRKALADLLAGGRT